MRFWKVGRNFAGRNVAREKCHTGRNVAQGEMSQGEKSQGEISQGEMSLREKCCTIARRFKMTYMKFDMIGMSSKLQNIFL